MALFRYTMAIMLHSQRYVPPALLFVVCTGIFANGAATQPVVPLFAAMTGVVFACSAWLTVSLVNVEDPVQRAITAVNVGILPVAVAVIVLGFALRRPRRPVPTKREGVK